MKTPGSALLGTLLFICVTPAVAQNPTAQSVPQTLSLERAIELGARYSPIYRQTLNDHGTAQWGVRNSYAAFLPTVTASGNVNYQGAGRQRFVSTEFQTSPTMGSGYSLNLNWLFNGNTILQPGVQKASLHATDATIDAAEMTLRAAIVQQYLAILQAQAQVQIDERQVQRNEENLRLAQARFDVGQTTMLDVRQAQVAKGQSEVALLQTQQLVRVERLRLFQTMGVPAPEDPDIIVLSDTFPVVEPTWVLTDLLNLADEDNPDVVSLRAQEVSAEWNERSVRSQWLPTVNFFAGWSGFTQEFTNTDLLLSQQQAQAAGNLVSCEGQNVINSSVGLPTSDCTRFEFTPETEAQLLSDNQVFPFNFTQQPFRAQLTISLPLFDQFNRNLQVSQASAQTDDAFELRRARELQVRTDVTQQYYGLLAAYQAIEIQVNNREAAQEQLRLARERYRVGSGTFIELLDAQIIGVQAEADLVNAQYAYHRSLAGLEAAVGQPLR